MNQLLNNANVNAQQGGAQTSQEVEGNRELGQIQLNIRVQYEKGAQQNVQLTLDQSAPFSILVQVIKQNVFAQNMSNDIYEESSKYSFNGMMLEESDMRSLQSIGLKNGSILDVNKTLREKQGVKKQAQTPECCSIQ